MTTAANPATKGQRALLSFSVEGLPPREELLLKSLVRLLDHRTHQHWAWKAGQADLRVVGGQASTATDDPAAAVPVLAIGQPDPQRGGHFLPLPLHADELEHTLNRLGALVVHARGLGLAASDGHIAENEEFRLLRWPPAALLETPARVRLATLMTGRPTSLLLLRQRSGLAPQDCLDFLADLRRAELLESARQPAPPAIAVGAAPIMLSTPSAPDSVLPVDSRPQALARDTVQPGLLARIRSRLGLLATGHK
ncbi:MULTISPECIES: hypothetical protein [Variovorax]|jgi:hypothetical protein|uniref:hypothetical protein n=1 Tax=Variovorax TaxID=34072 RepID=UPI000A505D15|nr:MULTISPECIES: hypothetical protein [Variovorax]UKI10586.1 hypothetical protein L3V85_12290 [Variovorax paradoxus]